MSDSDLLHQNHEVFRKDRDVERRLRRHMALVAHAARYHFKRTGGRVDYEDFWTAGALALLHAAKVHDDGRASFVGHARRRVKWAMKDVARRRLRRAVDLERGTPNFAALRFGDGNRRVSPVGLAEGHVGRAPEASDEWASTMDPTAEGAAISDEADPEGALLQREAAEKLRAAMSCLDARAQLLLGRRYVDGDSFADLARELGISTSAACRIHRRALETLGRALAGLYRDGVLE